MGFTQRILWVCVLGIIHSLFFSLVLAADKASTTLTLEQAILASLQLNTAIQLGEQQICASRAAVQGAYGQFDAVLSANAQHSRDATPPLLEATGITLPEDVSQSDTLGFGISKQFMSGMTFTQNINANTSYSDSQGFSDLPRFNSGNINFTLNIPLLAGSDVAIGVDLSKIQLQATKFSYLDTIAQTITSVTQAYWVVVAAQDNLKILQNAEKNALQFLEIYKRLVAADELPGADLILIQADTDNRIQARLSGEQALHDAKIALGVLIGFDACNIEDMGTLISTYFAVTDQTPDIDPLLNQPIETTFTKRNDLQALELGLAANYRSMKQAQLGLLPAVNLQLSRGESYTHVGSDIFSFLQGSSAKNYSAGVNASFPVPNRSARSGVAVAATAINQTKINLHNLKRQIQTDLAITRYGINILKEQIKYTQKAKDGYEIVVRNAILKYKMGLLTIIELVQVRDTLIQYEQALIAQNGSYSNAISTLLYQTGNTLLTENYETLDSIRVNLAYMQPKIRKEVKEQNEDIPLS